MWVLIGIEIGRDLLSDLCLFTEQLRSNDSSRVGRGQFKFQFDFIAHEKPVPLSKARHCRAMLKL
ncbi:hypothetical protein DAH52_22920 [Sphingomonas koreensis]|nr:hypothetical protein DAH52_22920 [Sphingomonas koreensis]